MNTRRQFSLLLSFLLATAAALAAPASGPAPDLQQRLDKGTAQLRFEPSSGYLNSVLEQLQIAPCSQLLVFSKTSCQRERISPRTPRAIYFNDRSYVAYIPGSKLLEISSVDPKLGAVFFTLEQNEIPKPQLVRRDQCLECHTSTATLNAPGYVVRSYTTDAAGVVDITQGSSMVDHRTPYLDRWGGWFLPSVSASTDGPAPALSPKPGAVALAGQADLSRYPRPSSDLAALIVLEHQAHMQNLITKLQIDAQRAGSDPAARTLDKEVADAFLRYLLFVDEAPLPAPIKAAPEFAAWFQAQGPRDKQGRSLRELDLQTRLFKYPCSYMLYSDAFDSLPRWVKLQLYHRLGKILSDDSAEPAFAAIPPPTRRALREILIDTKSDVPIEWKL